MAACRIGCAGAERAPLGASSGGAVRQELHHPDPVGGARAAGLLGAHTSQSPRVGADDDCVR
eukprot:1183147-Prymnesium_polylepis.1